MPRGRLSIAVDVIINVPDLSEISARLYVKLGRVIEKELDVMENYFKATYRNWSAKSKPIWNKNFGNPSRLAAGGGGALGTGRLNVPGLASFTKDEFAGQIATTSEPYVFVSGGTVGGRALFSDAYRPMTQPRVLNSRMRKGSAQGGIGFRIKGVRAREFEFEIAKRRTPYIVRRVEKAVDAELIKILTKGKRIVVHGSTR